MYAFLCTIKLVDGEVIVQKNSSESWRWEYYDCGFG